MTSPTGLENRSIMGIRPAKLALLEFIFVKIRISRSKTSRGVSYPTWSATRKGEGTCNPKKAIKFRNVSRRLQKIDVVDREPHWVTPQVPQISGPAPCV
jgi:hypothetical protein